MAWQLMRSKKSIALWQRVVCHGMWQFSSLALASAIVRISSSLFVVASLKLSGNLRFFVYSLTFDFHLLMETVACFCWSVLSQLWALYFCTYTWRICGYIPYPLFNEGSLGGRGKGGERGYINHLIRLFLVCAFTCNAFQEFYFGFILLGIVNTIAS